MHARAVLAVAAVAIPGRSVTAVTSIPSEKTELLSMSQIDLPNHSEEVGIKGGKKRTVEIDEKAGRP